MGERIKATYIPVGERPHLIGDAELMGFSGRLSPAALNKYFYDQGYVPYAVCGKVKYHMKDAVLKWIKDHDEQQTVRREVAQ